MANEKYVDETNLAEIARNTAKALVTSAPAVALTCAAMTGYGYLENNNPLNPREQEISDAMVINGLCMLGMISLYATGKMLKKAFPGW